MEQFLKDKKKIGICAVLFIVIILCLLKYVSSGFTELKKNDTENIFVEENNESEGTPNDNLNEEKEGSSSQKDSSKSQEVFTSDNKKKTITVEIKGEVNKPDVYSLEDSSIIKDLIEKAGGLTENADLSNINRAKKLQDHELIYIGNKNEASGGASGSAGGITPSSAMSSPVSSASGSKGGSSDSKININTAGADELKKINGIGDSKAQSIISYRESNGGFSSIEDLKNVDGIGEKMFEKMKDQVEV